MTTAAAAAAVGTEEVGGIEASAGVIEYSGAIEYTDGG